MKKLLLVLTFLGLTTGCGIAQQISKDCGGELNELCNGLFGDDGEETEAALLEAQRQFEEYKRQQALEEEYVIGVLYAISNQLALHMGQIYQLQNELGALQASLVQLQDEEAADVAALQALIDGLEADINAQSALVSALQVQSNANQIILAQLQGYGMVVEIVNPCGDQPGFDEVLLRLSTGQIIASFSDNASGANTRFTTIGNGSYSTTDGTNCAFTVLNGVVLW